MSLVHSREREWDLKVCVNRETCSVRITGCPYDHYKVITKNTICEPFFSPSFQILLSVFIGQAGGKIHCYNNTLKKN